MKLKLIALCMLISFSSNFGGSSCGNIGLVAKLVQDILDGINLILPKVNTITNLVLQDIALSEQILVEISLLDVSLSSQIENINCSIGDVIVTATVDLTPAINATQSVGTVLCSKIDALSTMVSVNDKIIISLLDQLETTTCGSCDLTPAINATQSVGTVLLSQIGSLSIQVSLGDAIINSKIGNLDQSGSCLESMIDVPQDINNLNLTIIQLLKTILLELRGCSC